MLLAGSTVTSAAHSYGHKTACSYSRVSECVSVLLDTTYTALNIIFILFTERRLAMKPNIATKVIPKDNKTGSSNRQASSEILTQERKCQMKSKIRKRKTDPNTHKQCSYSLSQPVISANSTSSRQILRNWQPPLKIFCHDHNTKNTAYNFISDLMPSTGNSSGEEVNRNTEIATDSTAVAAEQGKTENKTISCNDENGENIPLSQQSTQEYVPKETTRNTTKMEEGKYEESEMAETKNIEISCAIEEGGKNEPENNSDQMAQSLHITSNKDTSPLNIRVIMDMNSLSTSSTEYSEEKTDQGLPSTKHIKSNGNQTATAGDMGKDQDKEDSKPNIMSKSDNTVSPPGKNIPTKMNTSSHYQEEQKTKSSCDSLMCQIPNLTVKYPQYVCSLRTLTGSDEDSPLPLDLISNHSQLTWNMTGEMEQLTQIQTISEATTLKITEQKTGDNQCEENGSLSGQVLTPQDKADNGNHSPLVTKKVQQTVSNFGGKSEKECKESTFIPSLVTNDILLNRSDVDIDKLRQDLTVPVLAAAKPSEICTVESTKLQGHTDQADTETVIPRSTVESIMLQQGTEQADMETVTPICTAGITKSQRGTEQADSETVTPLSLPDPDPKLHIQSDSTKIPKKLCVMKEAKNVETASATPEKIKALVVSPTTAGNRCTEECPIKKYEEASDTASHSHVSARIETGQPGSDHNKSNENGSKCPVENVTEGTTDGEQAGSTGPPNVTCQSPLKKQCLPKENEIYQTTIGFRMSKDTFSKFPTALETSYVGSSPTASTNKTDLPGTDNPPINKNWQQSATTGHTEPIDTLHPPASAKKEFLPQQDEIKHSEIDFDNPEDKVHKFPTTLENTSHSTVPSNNETDHPGTDLNYHINDKCSKQPVKNGDGKDGDVKTGNMESLRTVQPSTPTRKEFLPKQDEINQSTVGFDNSQSIFCKSPTAAVEAPKILGQLGKLTNEYIPDTASHGYLLDDDIGLTGSQLLRIENQCQYNIQSTEDEWNHASSCGEARVPDADMLPTPRWVQSVQQKRQKLRSIIGDISRLK